MKALRVGVHAHHFFSDRFPIIGEVDCVLEALTHLVPTVEPNEGRHFADKRLRLWKDISVEAVKAPGDFPTDLDVGL